MFYKFICSPVGDLKLVSNNDVVLGVGWGKDRPTDGDEHGVESNDHPLLLKTEKQLSLYFAGELTEFSLPLAFTGTIFQKKVWAALLTIPYGETRSYSQIAAQIGQPQAVRAVGAANGKNPLAILAPCHRVIGATGCLTGFAGGVEAKARLLNLEKRDLFAGGRVMNPAF